MNAAISLVKPRAVRTGLALAILTGALLGGFGIVTPIENRLLDAGFVALRGEPIDPKGQEIIVIGIDERSVAAIPEPMALWHRQLGTLLTAAADGGARIVGLDLVLPDRGYASILPDLDRALVDGILRMRFAGGVVLALTVDEGLRPRPVHAPFLAAGGPGCAGKAFWREDSDHIVRAFDEGLGEHGEIVPTFVGQLARALGVTPVTGEINYALGNGFEVVSLDDVLQWAYAGDRDRLRQTMQGKIVLVGAILPFFDRVNTPLKLDRLSHNDGEPGVLVHAQTLRTLLAKRIVEPLPPWLAALLCGFAGLAWLAGRGPHRAAVVAAVVFATAIGAGLWALRQDVWLPVAAIITTAWLAAGSRLLLEGGGAWRERVRLRGAFAGYVSPQVMSEIENGHLAGLAVARRFICVLMLDVRGFTTRSEEEPPECIVEMLNALCEEATAAIHAQGGTVDKFMGDGILAFFGAPAPLTDPCGAGSAAARDILERVRLMSENLVAQGEAPIEIGIGLSCGDATVGHIGAATRHAYTAIGDCVNVAARLESLSKDLNYPLIMSQAVVERLVDREGMVALGMQVIKGHSSVEVYGWR